MPYTAKQKRLFGAKCGRGDRAMCKLLKEAKHYPTRRPVRKARRK